MAPKEHTLRRKISMIPCVRRRHVYLVAIPVLKVHRISDAIRELVLFEVANQHEQDRDSIGVSRLEIGTRSMEIVTHCAGDSKVYQGDDSEGCITRPLNMQLVEQPKKTRNNVPPSYLCPGMFPVYICECHWQNIDKIRHRTYVSTARANTATRQLGFHSSCSEDEPIPTP